MRCRFVSPETVRVDLSDGDWLECKRELTRGELGEVVDLTAGKRSVAGLAMVLSYLVDWSLCDVAGKRVQIGTTAARRAALEALSLADYREIEDAITGHIEAMTAAREEKKRAIATATITG